MFLNMRRIAVPGTEPAIGAGHLCQLGKMTQRKAGEFPLSGCEA